MPPRAKPPGWTDNTTKAVAAQMEAMDAQHVLAMDGGAGGIIAPASPIRIEGAGFGSDSLGDTTVTGSLARAANGHRKKIVDTTSIVNAGGTQTLDMSADVYVADFDHIGTNIAIQLQVTTGQTPGVGDVIEVARDQFPSGGGGSFQIYAEDAPAVRIGVFPQTAAGGNSLNGVTSARYFFNGTTWKPLRFSADAGV